MAIYEDYYVINSTSHIKSVSSFLSLEFLKELKNDDGTLGNWTIGHGFEYINGQPVTPQTTITEEQSLQILEDKITEIDSHFLENYPIYGVIYSH